MSKQELLEKLRSLMTSDDAERNHARADDLLLEYIDDAEITAAFTQLERWCA